MSGLLVVVSPDGTQRAIPWIKHGQPDLKILQEAVGGYIERVQVRWEGKLRYAYVNEDGHALRLAINAAGTSLLSQRLSGSFLVGPVAIWIPDPAKKQGAT